jgi:hypothetical protein
LLRSLFVAGLFFAAGVAHAQPGVDRLSERGVSDAYEAMETSYDLSNFVAQYGGDQVTSASQLRSRLGKNNVCGKDLDGLPGVPIDSICATMIHVYQAPGGVSYFLSTPVFALEATNPGRNAQAPVQLALVIGPRGQPALVKFADILPKPGSPPVINGAAADGAYQFTIVVGKMENNKADKAKQLPPEFFDHRPYRRG